MPPSIWLRNPSGFEIGPQSSAHTHRVTTDLPRVLIDVDLGDHRAVAVVALIEDTRDAAALGNSGLATRLR
jgi:hypothetical protein